MGDFTDVTPFYAEGGGQVGDTGLLVGDSGTGRVVDTDAPVPGAVRHRVQVEVGLFSVGDQVRMMVDRDRREAIRRSHTGTHLLHWALREEIGPHVRQQGSLVAPDYLRFDFSHHSQLTDGELERVERLVADQVLRDVAVRVELASQAAARAAGALSFFGERYGEVVRVVRTGEHSVELCGGTHVDALGHSRQRNCRTSTPDLGRAGGAARQPVWWTHRTETDAVHQRAAMPRWMRGI